MKKLLLSLILAGICAIATSTLSIAQGPNWTNDAGVSNVTDVYTANSRPSVTSAYFNNQVWVAYTSTTCSNGCAIKLTHSYATATPIAPGNLSFSTPAYVSVSGVGIVNSYNTPSLAAQGGYLYLAYNDAANNNWLTSSQDGVGWSAPYRLAPGYSTTWAPSLTADTYENTRLFVGYASSSTYTPIICDVYPNQSNLTISTQNCQSFTGVSQMNYNPGILAYGGVGEVTMAYEWRGDQHCLSGYVLDADTNYSYDYDASQNCSDQSSVAPSLALYTGRVFIAFGGNNSNRQFNVRFTDSNELDPIYKQTLPQQMNGSPDLLVISPPNYYPELVNFYVWNGQLRYLFGTY